MESEIAVVDEVIIGHKENQRASDRKDGFTECETGHLIVFAYDVTYIVIIVACMVAAAAAAAAVVILPTFVPRSACAVVGRSLDLISLKFISSGRIKVVPGQPLRIDAGVRCCSIGDIQEIKPRKNKKQKRCSRREKAIGRIPPWGGCCFQLTLVLSFGGGSRIRSSSIAQFNRERCNRSKYTHTTAYRDDSRQNM